MISVVVAWVLPWAAALTDAGIEQVAAVEVAAADSGRVAWVAAVVAAVFEWDCTDAHCCLRD